MSNLNSRQRRRNNWDKRNLKSQQMNSKDVNKHPLYEHIKTSADLLHISHVKAYRSRLTRGLFYNKCKHPGSKSIKQLLP